MNCPAKKISVLLFVMEALAGHCAAKPLSLERYRDEVRDIPIVYQFPDDPDRAAAVAYAAKVRDLAFPKSELIDASALSHDALKEKLAPGFFLYTVPGQSLYSLMKGPDISFGKDGLKIEGRYHRGGDLRLIYLAANPFSRGKAMVCVVSRNSVLKEGVRTGAASYQVFKGGSLVDEGYYDGEFRPLRGGLSQAEALADIDQFFSDAEQVHPDLLANISEEDYLRLKERTVNEVVPGSGIDGTVSRRDLAYALYSAAAAFGDGHTSIDFSALSPREKAEAGYPPFLLEFYNGDFFVSAAADKGLEGKKLVSVNGRPFEEFMRPVLERCSGELVHFKAARFMREQEFWWAFSRLFTGSARFTAEFTNSEGRLLRRRLDVIGPAEFSRLAPPAKKKESTRVEFLKDGVAYFRYPSFRHTEEEKKAIDGIFREIKARGLKKLLIDIRGNGGGHSGMADFILRYLTEKPVRAFSMLKLKVSRQYIDAHRAEAGEKADAFAGLLLTRRIEEKRQEKPEAFFTGRTYLLTDNFTFSSASGFAVMFRDYECGRIVGYETGGLPSSFGEVLSLRLRNSGINFGVSVKKFYSPFLKPGDDAHGVIPDLPVDTGVLAGYRTEDPLLSYAADKLTEEDQE